MKGVQVSNQKLQVVSRSEVGTEGLHQAEGMEGSYRGAEGKAASCLEEESPVG